MAAMSETITTEVPLRPTVSPPEAEEGKEPAKSFPFLTDEDIRDFAVRTALSGLSLEEGLSQFEQVKVLRLEAAEEEYEVQAARFQKRIVALEERINEEKKSLSDLKERESLIKDERLGLDSRNQLLELRKIMALVTMRVARLEKQRQFFVEEEQKLQEKHREVKDAIEAWREKELSDAKKLHEMLLEISSTDEEELRRRASVLEGEKNRLESTYVR
jgi:hypothetical protein